MRLQLAALLGKHLENLSNLFLLNLVLGGGIRGDEAAYERDLHQSVYDLAVPGLYVLRTFRLPGGVQHGHLQGGPEGQQREGEANQAAAERDRTGDHAHGGEEHDLVHLGDEGVLVNWI